MERIPLIDISSEDDLLLISASTFDFPNPNTPEKCDVYNFIGLENGSDQERRNSTVVNNQTDQVPELSESPERKQTISGKFNLRKSLAWDKAFFTSEGVLNTEELAIVNSTFRKTESHALPVIQEDIRKSAESTSTLDSDSWALENLEVDLFENLRASIQKSYDNCNEAPRMIHSRRIVKPGEAARCIGPSSKVGFSSQSKIKPPNVMKRHGVSKQQQEDTSKGPSLHAQTVNKSGDSKSLLKPPRITPRSSPLPAVPNKKSSTDSANIQLKSNAAKVLSGNVAKRQSLISSKKNHMDSGSITPRSFPLMKSSSGSSLVNVVPSPASCSSFNNLAGSSSDSAGQSPMEIRRRKLECRNIKYSSSGSTCKAPLRTSKSKIGFRGANSSLACQNSAIQSSSVSPASSIDSVASESSSISIGLKSSNSTESLDVGFSSSSSSIAAPSHDPQQSQLRKFSIGQTVKNEDKNTMKVSSVVNASSQPGSGDHGSSNINNDLGSKCFKPSGLRLPSPKIGYFDVEKTSVQNSNKYSHMEINLLKTTRSSNDNSSNKTRSSKLRSLRPATHCDSPHTQSRKSPSDHCMEAVPLSSLHVSKIADATSRVTVSQSDTDSSPRASEGNYLKDFNKAVDRVECGYEQDANQSSSKLSTTDLAKSDGPLILDESSAVKCKNAQPSYQVGEEENINIEIDLIQIAKCKRNEKENLIPRDQNGGLSKRVEE